MPVERVDTPTAATKQLRSDPDIGPLIAEHGHLQLVPADGIYERMVTSVIRQQVSMASAEATRERLHSEFTVEPQVIATAETASLHEVGLSEAKAEYIQHIADAFITNGYDRDYFAMLSDSEVIDELTSIRGVGPWTAKMVLMFGLGREDVFPVEDLGIRKGMEAVFDEELTRGEMRTRAEAWAPYRSIASSYLWRAVEG